MEKRNIKYYDELHLYLLDDWLVVPSVTQILHEIFPDKYKNVPQWILNNKANYGSLIHETIELFESGREAEAVMKTDSVYVSEALQQYWNLKEKYNIKVLEQEKIIAYKNLYAGRFDMIAEIDGLNCLCDIKTTAEVDKEYLSWQLSMYELAYGSKFDKLYCIWLPKGGIGKLIEIDRVEKVEEKLKEIGIGE